jgi:hypothetical protein
MNAPPRKFKDMRLERITSSALDRYTLGEDSKTFRDPRIDRVISHTPDIFARQNKLDVLGKPTGIGVEHMNEGASSSRFHRHDLPPQNPVTGRQSGTFGSRTTLFSGSLKNESIQKSKKKEEEEAQSKIEKKLDETVAESKTDGRAEKVGAELKRRR